VRADGESGGCEQHVLPGCADGEGEPAFVDEPVVTVAEADQVGQAGAVAVGPVPQMMDHSGRLGAARDPAAAVVAKVDRAAEPAADPPGASPQVQQLSVGAAGGDAGRAVTGQPAGGGRVQPVVPEHDPVRPVVASDVGLGECVGCRVQDELEPVGLGRGGACCGRL